MPWHYLYDTASGRLRGESLTPPDAAVVAALNGTVLVLDARALDAQMWDTATRAFVARPAKVLVDRMDDIAADARWDGIRTRLTAPQRDTLVALITELLGTRRFRRTDDPAVIA
jgi:hypothetical protein